MRLGLLGDELLEPNSTKTEDAVCSCFRRVCRYGKQQATVTVLSPGVSSLSQVVDVDYMLYKFSTLTTAKREDMLAGSYASTQTNTCLAGCQASIVMFCGGSSMAKVLTRFHCAAGCC